MYNELANKGNESPKGLIPCSAALADSVPAQQPEQPGPLYKPYTDDPVSPEPYRPYADKPVLAEPPYEPYKGI